MPRILVIGAHPDDAEVKAGGTAIQWVRHGFEVTFVSVTDGSAGHHVMSAPELAARRKREAEAAAKVLGVRAMILGFPDGGLLPTLEARDAIIRLIRQIDPDLVLTHRPNDYHPDHRYTSQLVQDAAYMVTVPRVAPAIPALRRDPVFGYLSDRFQKPVPFSADVIVPINDVLPQVIAAFDCHESQFYEWLPYNMGILDAVPAEPEKRSLLLKEWFTASYARRLDEWPDRASGQAVSFVEAFEISEYGAPLTPMLRETLFPFLTF